MAIITRWRMPPDSWCGYWSSRLSGSVMPTSVSSSIARARAVASSMPRWMVSGSMICSPILSTGLSEVIGSWKIMAISRPRMRRISSSESFSSSRPSKRIDALGDARRARRQQAHDGERRHRLAGARLADDRHHLAGVDRVAQALDRAHGAVRGHELHVEVFDLEQGLARPGRHAAAVAGSSKRPIAEGRDDLVVQPSSSLARDRPCSCRVAAWPPAHDIPSPC